MGPVKKMKVVIDTNVIISALLFGGTPGRLIPLWQKGRVKPQASKEMIDEYLKVLAYPKFELSEKEITYLLHKEILPYCDIVASGSGETIVKDDPSD
ncbi:MAG: putative toxin-antitoxin system toxin component, PIN family, partial [Deltaproteobacteria bacterium]|nr:putative toxin-antitoxin system toxin component, PIN family [Deltaproteobacteria bacterium]